VTHISVEIAEKDYGITCSHEKMKNEEIRFRLNCDDGSAYIRTVGGDKGGWQNSHFHQSIRETYIVQKGWMALASVGKEKLELSLYRSGENVTTEPFVVHNIYLPAGAVIHTVKHGLAEGKDWCGDEELDKMTKTLNENDIARLASRRNSEDYEIDPRFNSYINVYNNLDNLLWRIPSIFIGGAAILLGFVANIASNPDASLSHELWATMFFLVGTLFLLGTYSMSRIRIHHTRMGEELKALEPIGYFRTRGETVQKSWPPSAPSIFMRAFAAVGLALLGLGIMAIVDFEILKPFLMQPAKP